MSTFKEIIDKENIRSLVMRDITCMRTGKVLDAQKCAVVRDGDGDVVAVLDPSCADDDELVQKLADRGMTLAKQGSE